MRAAALLSLCLGAFMLPTRGGARGGATVVETIQTPKRSRAQRQKSAPADYVSAEDQDAGDGPEPQILWQDLYCAAGDTQIIGRTSGRALSGRLMAIIGPSGSGKTMLLSALAGMLPRHAGLQLTGRVLDARNCRVSVQDGDVAVLPQNDAFFSELTVEEVLSFVMRMKSRAVDEEELSRVLRSLGLDHVRARRVGDRGASSTATGLSGGERRRLSVACELLAGGGNPRLLLADEPTTGLDSTGAERVMGLLRELSVDCRMPVVAVLHQPSSRTWRLIDDVCVIAPGGEI